MQRFSELHFPRGCPSRAGRQKQFWLGDETPFMQNSAWISLLQLMPPSRHDSLTIMTTIGLEISVQNVFRLEEEFLVVRGRLGGTTDAGRVFMIPYEEIHYLGFQKPMNEADIAAIFGGGPALAETQQANHTVAEEQTPVPAESGPTSAGVEAPSVGVEPSPTPDTFAPKAKPPSKMVLLERVRARLAAAGKSSSGKVS
jgi:hypothetical protein